MCGAAAPGMCTGDSAATSGCSPRSKSSAIPALNAEFIVNAGALLFEKDMPRNLRSIQKGNRSYRKFFSLRRSRLNSRPGESSRASSKDGRIVERHDAPGRVRHLRDPAIYREGRQAYLVYSIAGESGLAIAKLVE